MTHRRWSFLPRARSSVDHRDHRSDDASPTARRAPMAISPAPRPARARVARSTRSVPRTTGQGRGGKHRGTRRRPRRGGLSRAGGTRPPRAQRNLLGARRRIAWAPAHPVGARPVLAADVVRVTRAADAAIRPLGGEESHFRATGRRASLPPMPPPAAWTSINFDPEHRLQLARRPARVDRAMPATGRRRTRPRRAGVGDPARRLWRGFPQTAQQGFGDAAAM